MCICMCVYIYIYICVYISWPHAPGARTGSLRRPQAEGILLVRIINKYAYFNDISLCL